MTLKLALTALWCASVAEQVTLVAPIGKVAPVGTEQLGVTDPSTRSVAEAVYATTAPAELVASTVIVPGTVNVGAFVSATVTAKTALVLLPCESVAVQPIVVAPIGNVVPEAGAQLVATLRSTRSLAVTEYATVAPAGEVASTPGTVGTVSAGPVVSVTTTENESLLEL